MRFSITIMAAMAGLATAAPLTERQLLQPWFGLIIKNADDGTPAGIFHAATSDINICPDQTDPGTTLKIKDGKLMSKDGKKAVSMLDGGMIGWVPLAEGTLGFSLSKTNELVFGGAGFCNKDGKLSVAGIGGTNCRSVKLLATQYFTPDLTA